MLVHDDIGWGHHTLYYWFSVKRFFRLCFSIRVVVSSYPSMCVFTFHVGVQSIVKWQIHRVHRKDWVGEHQGKPESAGLHVVVNIESKQPMYLFQQDT